MATIEALLMTAEQFLALPDDGTDRWLVRGELREQPMTYRNQFHSGIEAIFAAELINWLRRSSEPRGKVLSGEAGVRLPGDPASIFGIDVVYIDAQVMSKQSANSTIIVGVPTVAVEIESPSDTNESIREKVECYQAAGVPLVWVVDPYLKTVMEFRLGKLPILLNLDHELVGDPVMPGFRVAVKDLFA